MPFVYMQSSGLVAKVSKELASALALRMHEASGVVADSLLLGRGYSGKGLTRATGRNNPDLEHVKATGPLPRGWWKIGKPRRSKNVGPHAMDLTPVNHTAHGRTAFMIHGDDRESDASKGCIILSRRIRELISGSGDTDLLVIR